MQEYHIDTYPTLFQYVWVKIIGDNLSVREIEGSTHIIFIGQDKPVFHQYSFSAKMWKRPQSRKYFVINI